MPKKKEIGNLALTGYSELFASTVEAAEPNLTIQAQDKEGERIVQIPLTDLHPPEFHPFQVNDDEAMDRLTENIRQYGVREPGIVRPRHDNSGNQIDGYELLAGNRRKRACELANMTAMPVIIREMDDDLATIAMVDSNLQQREKLLPSEKAWAYKVKMEALNHNGIKGEKLSHEVIMEQTGDSKNQIFRLIRLTELVADLIDRVDNRQLAFNPAVELSYLSQTQQMAVVRAMDSHVFKPSLSQAVRLKKLMQAGELTLDMVDEILSEVKKEPKEVKVSADSGGCAVSEESTESDNSGEISQFQEFFPSGYTIRQMSDVIADLLREWQSSVDMRLYMDGATA